MPYDERLVQRVRAELEQRPDVETVGERKMFGGLGFMVGGRMACAVLGETLLVRLGADADAALDEPHTRPMDFTGRPARGSLFVDPPGITSDAALAAWVQRGVSYALASARS